MFNHCRQNRARSRAPWRSSRKPYHRLELETSTQRVSTLQFGGKTDKLVIMLLFRGDFKERRNSARQNLRTSESRPAFLREIQSSFRFLTTHCPSEHNSARSFLVDFSILEISKKTLFPSSKFHNPAGWQSKTILLSSSTCLIAFRTILQRRTNASVLSQSFSSCVPPRRSFRRSSVFAISAPLA
jgi:hypothetical protein